jgi:hypothetical protein
MPVKTPKTPLLPGLLIVACLFALTTCKPPGFDDLPEVEWVITHVYKTSNGAVVRFRKIGETSYTASFYYHDENCKVNMDANRLVLINGLPITDRQSLRDRGGGVWEVYFVILTEMPIDVGNIMSFKDDWFFVRDSGSWAGTATKWKVRIITPAMVIEPLPPGGYLSD